MRDKHSAVKHYAYLGDPEATHAADLEQLFFGFSPETRNIVDEKTCKAIDKLIAENPKLTELEAYRQIYRKRTNPHYRQENT